MHSFRSCLFLIAVAVTSCTSPDDEVSRYVAARATYQRAFDSLWSKSPTEAMKVNGAWVRDYGPRLRRIIGPFRMAGLSDSVKTHIGSMSAIYEGDALPDGFVYRTTDSVEIFVTDTVVFRAWAAQTRRKADGAEAIMRGPGLFAEIFDTGAAAYHCADLPEIHRSLTAMLIEYSQDHGSVCMPQYIVVSVMTGRRLLAAQQSIPRSARSDPRRIAALAQALVDRLR